MSTSLPPRLLSIAGSDSSGGAGIQADIKTITALGGYAMTAVTAVTIQDTQQVHSIISIPANAVSSQIKVALDDIGADSIKTGMLGDVELIEAVCESLTLHAAALPCVVDPVMIASSGDILLPPKAIEAVRSLMLPGRILTPNAPEAAHLTRRAVENLDDQRRAADHLLEMGVAGVLLKGGHIAGNVIHDVLSTPDGERLFSTPRLGTTPVHGTGCTLAAALALFLARHLTLESAAQQALEWLASTLRARPGLGSGAQALHHGWKQTPPSVQQSPQP